MEFLTTYGWAFLVILVAIGALAYFGVINPNKLLPERCQFQQEMACKEFMGTYVAGPPVTATIKFFATNNIGAGMTNVSFSIAQQGGTLKNCLSAGTTIGAGQSVEFTCESISGSFVKGEKSKFAVNGTYKQAGGQYSKPLQGELFVTLQ